MLAGNKGVSLDISIIPLKEWSYFDELVNSINFEQTNSKLKTIRIESGSSLRNWINFIFVIFLILITNLLTWWVPKFELEDDSTKCRKNLNKGVKKLNQFFTFTIYLRTTLESYQFLLLVVISNTNEFDTTNAVKVVSLVFSIFALSCLVIFIFWAFYVYYVSYDAKQNMPRLKWEEFLGGIKSSNTPRIFSFLSLMRRLAMIILLIWGEELDPLIVLFGLVLILIPYLIYIIAVRPFEKVSNNIIEIMNEIFYLIITSWLCYFRREDYWSKPVTNTYISIIAGNTYIITIIILICFIIKIWRYCDHWCWKRERRVMTKPTVIKIKHTQNNLGVSPNVSFVQSTSKMNPGRMNSKRMNSGRMNSGRMNSGRKNSGRKNPVQMNVDRELEIFYSRRN